MDKSTLKSILRDWSYYDGLPRFWLRTQKIRGTLTPDLVRVIQGVRRCGKSTYLAQIIQERDLPLKSCHIINFEDPRLVNESTADRSHLLLDSIVEATDSLEPQYYFFDEIQNLKGWEKWMRLHLDRPKNKFFFVTGSNAHLLSGELGSKLTGRHITEELAPLSFYEFKQVFPQKTLQDYLFSGGFPRPLQIDFGDRLLTEYFRDIITRDVAQRLKLRNPDQLFRLIQMVFESSGSQLSYRKLAAAIGISPDTVSAHLDAAEQAYLIFKCPYFDHSERKRSRRNRKYYPVDPGLRRIVVTKSGKDLGKSLENATFLELRKHFLQTFYWYETHEVDFVCETPQGLLPIQVTWDKHQGRHEAGLIEFYKRYPTALEGLVVNSTNFEDLTNLLLGYQ